MWKIKDDQDFEKKSEELISETINGLEMETVLDFLKFLYELQKDQKSKNPQDQDKVPASAKEMLNNTKGNNFISSKQLMTT